MLEESYKNSMDPNEMARLQEQFQIQENYLANLQSENQELAETCAKMQQIMQSQQEDNEVESKLRSKLNRIISNKKKLSKDLKSKDRELKQLRTDLAMARQISKGGSGSGGKEQSEKLAKCQRDLEDRNKQLGKLRKDCEDKDSRIRKLQDEVAELRARSTVSQSQQPQQTQEVAKVRPTTAKAPPRKEPSEESGDQSEESGKGEVEEEYRDEFNDDSDGDDKEEPIDEDEGQVEEVAVKEEEFRGEQKAIISESDVDPLFDKLKLLLQHNKIKYSSMGQQLLPSEVTIMKLEHKLKSLGLKDAEERLTLCRYIVEPRSEKKIEFKENREIAREKAENVLKSKLESYKTYENDEEEMRQRVKQQVGRFMSTLKDALECEDLDGTGYIPARTLKSCFHAMDINLDDDLIDYLIYASGTLDKIGNSSHLMLEYNKIIELIEAAGTQSPSNQAEQLLNDDNYSDDYGNDFEEQKDNKEDNEDEESQYTQPQVKPSQDTEPQQITGEEGEGELDEEIDDEQMISIAENCLIRIAEELLEKKLTIRQLFKGDIIEEEIEGEKIELLFPTSFLDGIQKLGITEFSDLENA